MTTISIINVLVLRVGETHILNKFKRFQKNNVLKKIMFILFGKIYRENSM